MDSNNLGTRPDLVPTPPAGGVAEVNVTPLIDVLLVLLITFFIAAAMSRRSLPIQLPSGAPAGSITPPQIVLQLANDGQYRINGQPVPAGTLPELLRVLFRDRPVKLLFIDVAGERSYQDFIATADLARGAGVTMVAEMSGRTRRQ